MTTQYFILMTEASSGTLSYSTIMNIYTMGYIFLGQIILGFNFGKKISITAILSALYNLINKVELGYRHLGCRDILAAEPIEWYQPILPKHVLFCRSQRDIHGITDLFTISGTPFSPQHLCRDSEIFNGTISYPLCQRPF
jgi:hypothetical protein